MTNGDKIRKAITDEWLAWYINYYFDADMQNNVILQQVPRNLMDCNKCRYNDAEKEVYKKALELAFKSVRVEYDGYCYFEFNGSELYWTTDTTKLMEACLDQARKELEDGKA